MKKIFIFTSIFFLFLGSRSPLAQTINLSNSGDLTAEEFDELGFDPTGLVGWWRLDGNGLDSSGKGNNGTVINATVTTNRFNVANKAMSFNQAGIDLGDKSIYVLSALTVSLWTKINGAGTQIDGNYLISKGRSDSVPYFSYIIRHLENTNRYNWLLGFTDATYGSINAEGYPIADHNWHHLLGTYDGAKMTFYIDGILIEEKNYIGKNIKYNFPNNNLYIGWWYYSSALKRAFNGDIDEVKIFNRALSATEILDMYNFEKDAKFSIEKTSGKVTAVEFVEDAGLPVEMRSKKDNLTVKGTFVEE